MRSPLLASSPAACSLLHTVVICPCPAGETGLNVVPSHRPAWVALLGPQEGSKLHTMLGRCSLASPSLAASHQHPTMASPCSSRIGVMSPSPGLLGVADTSLAIPHLGIQRAVEVLEGKTKLSSCPSVGTMPCEQGCCS
ncbi:cortexin 1 [Columba livia]|uniref:Cortexin 1 n=1 Tax=Columba livia TaxID=8932 RepID=A0A2I0LMA4_COLLI|nr:cortexin 1 [Columba livia]